MKYLKKKFQELNPYKIEEIKEGIFLNANEAGYDTPIEIRKHLSDYLLNNSLNRYPSSTSEKLKKAISEAFNISTNNIACGVGSDELIDILLRSTVQGGKVLSSVPSFSMYKIFTFMNEGDFIGVEANEDFSYNVDLMIEKIKEEKPIVTFICNPNNPTGAMMSISDIKRIASLNIGIVVVDEAYEDFANNSAVALINEFNNICVLKTFSKAFALAGIRCGYMIASNDIVNIVNTVKPPYTLNTITEEIASFAILNKKYYLPLIDEVIKDRDNEYEELVKLGIKVFKSNANFLFMELNDKILDNMEKNHIYLRKMGKYTRVTIGTKKENAAFMKALKEVL